MQVATFKAAEAQAGESAQPNTTSTSASTSTVTAADTARDAGVSQAISAVRSLAAPAVSSPLFVGDYSTGNFSQWRLVQYADGSTLWGQRTSQHIRAYPRRRHIRQKNQVRGTQWRPCCYW